MQMRVNVASETREFEQVAAVTRQLLKEIRETVDARATLAATESELGSKGDAVEFAQIILAVVTGGTLTKLIELLFGFLSRNKTFDIEVENKAGAKLKLKFDYVSGGERDRALELLTRFLEE